jgi:hypothetical protein
MTFSVTASERRTSREVVAGAGSLGGIGGGTIPIPLRSE